jgi:hypothetical protein
MAQRAKFRLRVSLALIAGVAGFAAPAAAQMDFFRGGFFGGGGNNYPSNPSYIPYNPFYPRPQVPAESIKPPPPKKVETPPTQTVVVIGDSLAEWLAYGLEEAFADTPDVGIERKIRPYSGLVRYDAKPDSPDWSQAIKDALDSEKPAAIVVMLGINDRLPLRERAPPAKDKDKDKDKDKKGATAPQGQGANAAESAASEPPPPPDAEQPSIIANEPQRRPVAAGSYYEFHTDKWAELYAKRVDEMIAALKSKGVPILWVGMPAVRGAKSTSDMSYLDELYHARADKAGIVYVDIWDGFVDERGNYAQQGPDFEGQTRRLRTYDGVHFTKPGAEKLAHYVERELRRVLISRATPVALPGPEEPGKGGSRSVIGPVVPLNANAGGERGELLGATNHPAQREADPVATRVLSHGEALAAPPGRADDFSWPRVDANAGDADVPAAVAPAGAAAPPKGAAAKTESGKTDPSKGEATRKANDVKNPQAPAAATPAPPKPRRTGEQLDGAPPRPPLPVGPAAANSRGGF